MKNTSHQIFDLLKEQIGLPDRAVLVSLVLQMATDDNATVTVTSYQLDESGKFILDNAGGCRTVTKTWEIEELLNGN